MKMTRQLVESWRQSTETRTHGISISSSSLTFFYFLSTIYLFQVPESVVTNYLLQAMIFIFTLFCAVNSINAFLQSPRIAPNDNNLRFARKIGQRGNLSPNEEVEQLLAKAKAIRDSLPPENEERNISRKLNDRNFDDEVDEEEESCQTFNYRVYADIGRESGTWMDPRWGASGSRIEFTVDVSFAAQSINDEGFDVSLANVEISKQMVKDNLSGKSTQVRNLSPINKKARLRGGFDSMDCFDGGYRVDVGKSSSNTIRFFMEVDGVEKPSYGDISIPKGCLYFSLACFGNNARQLSTKEGIVSVRQVGWNTGK